MAQQPATHPDQQTLTAFGQGTLQDDQLRSAVSSHVAQCPACRYLVTTVPRDDFLRLLRQVGRSPGGAAVTVPAAATSPAPPAPPPPARAPESLLQTQPGDTGAPAFAGPEVQPRQGATIPQLDGLTAPPVPKNDDIRDTVGSPQGATPTNSAFWGPTQPIAVGPAPRVATSTLPSTGPSRAAVDIGIPGYQILDQGKRGGMGVVYKALQSSVNRVVALKMLKEGMQGMGLLARFHREAEAVAKLSHPNIVPLFEFGEHQGCPYFALEYVPGGDLAEKWGRKPQPPREAAATVATLARAMHYAHEEGVAHRDLKPANVLIDKYGQPKITDFGLVKNLDPKAPAGDTSILSGGAGPEGTSVGQILGTPAYMAPEQAQGGSTVGPPADIYALGVILYEGLTGKVPFEGPSITVLAQVLERQPDPPSRVRKGIPRDLEAICLKCLRKAPEERYTSARALADDLQRFLDGLPVEARPIGRWERTWKYVRREPKTAALLLLIFLALLSGVLGASYYAVEASRSARDAREQAKLAEERRKEAKDKEEEARKSETRAKRSEADALREKRISDQLGYGARVARAYGAWQQGQVSRALQLLDDLSEDENRGWELGYVRRLCHLDLLTLQGHAGDVRCVVWSPDDRWLASAGDDHVIRLWDPATGKPLGELKGHTARINALAVSPNGKYLASASDDATVRVWEPAKGTHVTTYNDHALPVYDVAISPDGKWLASAGADVAIFVRDLAKNSAPQVLLGHINEVYRLAFSPDSQKLASASDDKSTRLWSLTSFQELDRVQTPTAALAVTISPDGKRLAVGEANGDCWVWEMENLRTRPVRFEQHTRGVTDLLFKPDSRRIVSVGFDRTIRIWNPVMAEGHGALRGHQGTIWRLALSRDGRHAATAGADGTLKVWDLTRHPYGREATQHQLQVTALAWSADGSTLVSGSDDRNVLVWDPRTMTVKKQLGDTTVLRDPPENLQDYGRVRDIQTKHGHNGAVRCVAVTRDGSKVASASADLTARIWDPRTGRPLHLLKHAAFVSSVAFSPDGKLLATGCYDDSVHLWDAELGVELIALPGHTKNVHTVVFSPDGKLLASASADETIRLWEVSEPRKAREVKVLKGHTAAVHSVAFRPDGQVLASGSEDQTIVLWDTATWKPKLTLVGHLGAAHFLAWSRDGKRLASSSLTSVDVGIRVWDAENGQELVRLFDGSGQMAFSKDGKILASGSRGPKIFLFESTPIDDQPRRVARYQPRTPQPVPPAGVGELRCLGYFIARELTQANAEQPNASFKAKAGKVFVVAVLSLLYRDFQMSEKEYDEYVDIRRKRFPDLGPPVPRPCLSHVQGRRFKLLAEGKQEAIYLGSWPRCIQLGSGFFDFGFYHSTQDPPDLNERFCVAVAWEVDAAVAQRSFEVQVDERPPVRIPAVRLKK